MDIKRLDGFMNFCDFQNGEVQIGAPNICDWKRDIQRTKLTLLGSSQISHYE